MEGFVHNLSGLLFIVVHKPADSSLDEIAIFGVEATPGAVFSGPYSLCYFMLGLCIHGLSAPKTCLYITRHVKW